MIEIKCQTKDGILLQDVVPFQGNLKERTAQNIDELCASLQREGLLMPLAIWQHDNKNYLLDGHGRLQALLQLSLEDLSIMQMPFPCVYVRADTEEDARKALLQITSSYGKITKKGVQEFTATIPDYSAPAIAKFTPKLTETKVHVTSSDTSVIRLRVPKDKAEEVKALLSTINYIQVL